VSIADAGAARLSVAGFYKLLLPLLLLLLAIGAASGFC